MKKQSRRNGNRQNGSRQNGTKNPVDEMGVNCAIEKEVMEVTFKPDIKPTNGNLQCLWSIISPRNSWAN